MTRRATGDGVEAEPTAGATPAADAEAMLAALRAAGYEPAPVLRRRPDHVEILASRDGHTFEVRLEFDGRIRQVAPRAFAPSTTADER